MFTTVLLFLASAIAIYIACGYFVNGIEWLGRKCKISETATGTVLAAFGTALPESAVTFAAVIGADDVQKEIGVGAALGGPLVLSTISYAMVGFMLWRCARKLGRKNEHLHTDQKRLSRDQAWFLGIFAFKIALGFMAFPGKQWLGLLFIAAYGIYVWREMIGADEGETESSKLDPLSMCPKRENPPLSMVLVQTLGALAVIGFASHIFVGQVQGIGTVLGMSSQLVALLLSPVATELPETMNAIIWVRQGKERLALANISGAMMIQATIPSALGLLFTPWILTTPLLIAGAVTALAIIALFLIFRRGQVNAKQLICVGFGYVVFAVALML